MPAADSLPEPDLAVVERGADLDRHPTTALLVVEIAIGSYASDTTVKSALYASADVPDYWVVDVARGRVEVRREPLGHEFRRTEILGSDDRVAPLCLNLAPLEIAALLRR